MNIFVRLALILGLCAPLCLTASERPNILVILTDDMGYSDLRCYGGEIQTPNLDSLAEGGIRYTQMYNTSKCWTTRISLLTGLYHLRSDRDFRNTALAGEVLRPAGYHTWWSGKHHASFNPHERGFDHFSGFLGGAINFWNPSDQARENEPLPGWRATYTWAFDDQLVRPFVPEPDFYATDDFTDWALNWLKQSQDSDQPFFLYLAYNAPHWPLHAHPEDIAKYKGVYSKGYEAVRQARYARQLESGLYDGMNAPLSLADHRRWSDLSSKERSEEVLRMQIHAAMVDNVDQNIGRLITALKDQDRFENTLILFLVDNGASHERPRNQKNSDPEAPWGSVGSFEAIGSDWANVANTPLRKWKITSMEGGISTPMIAHWPAGITAPPGSFCREASHLVDLLPTFMELAGPDREYPEDIPPPDGVSLTPTFSGESLNRVHPLYFHYQNWQAIREGPWKLVQNKSNPWELYHLHQDRTETENLANQFPERVASMARRWEVWYEETTGKKWKKPSEEPVKAKGDTP